MVLAESSIWIDFFRNGNGHLRELTSAGDVIMHDHLLGEIALGSLRDRTSTLRDLADFPRVPVAKDSEVMALIESHKLFSRAIGYTDAHLLASAALDGALALWTRDGRLAAVSSDLGMAYRKPRIRGTSA